MFGRDPAKQLAGQPISARSLNRYRDAARAIFGLRAAAPLEVQWVAGAPLLRLAPGGGGLWGVLTPAGGIAAATAPVPASGGTPAVPPVPQSATCAFHTLVGGKWADTATTVVAFNGMTGSVGGAKYCFVLQAPDGTWYITGEPC